MANILSLVQLCSRAASPEGVAVFGKGGYSVATIVKPGGTTSERVELMHTQLATQVLRKDGPQGGLMRYEVLSTAMHPDVSLALTMILCTWIPEHKVPWLSREVHVNENSGTKPQ